MQSRIFNLNWESFNYRDPEQRKCLGGALQYFLALPDLFIPKQFADIQAFSETKRVIREAAFKIQQFAGPSDFPASILPIIEKYHIIPSYDNAYELIFQVNDYTGSGRNGFSVTDVQSGLSFRRLKIGEKAKVYQMSGDRHFCYFDFYAGALGWHRSLFDDGEWWTIEDNAIEFRNKAYAARATSFYALIEAAGDTKSACIELVDPECTSCDALAVADANAINTAAQTIALATRGKGYGDVVNATYIVLTPLQLRGRIRRALAVNLQAFAGSEKIVDFNFQQITSSMLTNANRYYVILPKIKLKGGYRMDLSLFSDFDILSYSDVQAGWMRYGACIGDLDQIECIDATIPSGVPGGRDHQ
jgi:hypothetical protein